VRRRD